MKKRNGSATLRIQIADDRSVVLYKRLRRELVDTRTAIEELRQELDDVRHMRLGAPAVP